MPDETPRTGGCLCGAVRYRYAGPLRPVVACHCEQCRRTSGHFAAGTQGHRECLTLEDADTLQWYESTPGVHRGFCTGCGSSLFWTRDPARITIMAGTLDRPTGLRLTHQIFTAYASDYYTVDPNLPGAAEWCDSLPGIPEPDPAD